VRRTPATYDRILKHIVGHETTALHRDAAAGPARRYIEEFSASGRRADEVEKDLDQPLYAAVWAKSRTSA